MQTKRWTLPLALGVITVILVAVALWPQETLKGKAVVAGRDLGAGMTLTAADLTMVELDAAAIPADAIADPIRLAGQTLAIVRFKGEPITPRHLGQAVTLAPDERGVAIKVQADTGLAGLLRPGMFVGVVATLADTGGSGRDIYAKSLLEGLRVLYVSPDFQARPYTPATAQATVQTGGRGALGLSGETASPGDTGQVREGVIVLAASTQAQPVRYETITDTLKLRAESGAPISDTLKTPIVGLKKPEPVVRWVVPVELLTGLNAQGNSLALVLLPSNAKSYTTAGLTVGDVRVADKELRR